MDLAIIGGGPAALTAALYAARAGLQVRLFERGALGGALSTFQEMHNFPGFVGSNAELIENLRSQAVQAGASIEYGECMDVRILEHALESDAADGARFALDIDGDEVRAAAVLVATGSEPRPLELELDIPVSYCAWCDGDLAKKKHIAVIGGANSAAQEALYLSKIAHDVTVITHSALKCDEALKKSLSAASNITVQEHVEPTADLLNQFNYVFVFIGKRPATAFLQNLTASVSASTTGAPTAVLDGNGHLRTADAASHATSVPGLFAAGDVRSGAVRQAVTAAADGAAAALEIAQWLSKTS